MTTHFMTISDTEHRAILDAVTARRPLTAADVATHEWLHLYTAGWTNLYGDLLQPAYTYAASPEAAARELQRFHALQGASTDEQYAYVKARHATLANLTTPWYRRVAATVTLQAFVVFLCILLITVWIIYIVPAMMGF